LIIFFISSVSALSYPDSGNIYTAIVLPSSSLGIFNRYLQCEVMYLQMKDKKNILTIILGVVIGVLILIIETKAQSDVGFIYGKIYTISGDTYQGQIRWGKEETYWTDHFNSTKTRDNHLKHLSVDDQKHLDKKGERRVVGTRLGIFKHLGR